MHWLLFLQGHPNNSWMRGRAERWISVRFLQGPTRAHQTYSTDYAMLQSPSSVGVLFGRFVRLCAIFLQPKTRPFVNLSLYGVMNYEAPNLFHISRPSGFQNLIKLYADCRQQFTTSFCFTCSNWNYSTVVLVPHGSKAEKASSELGTFFPLEPVAVL